MVRKDKLAIRGAAAAVAAAATMPDAGAAAASASVLPEASAVDAAPVKRPPGRPRKHPIVVGAPSAAEPSLNVNERPRRQIQHKFIRNKSYALDSSGLSESSANTPASPSGSGEVKRKRGRPRKIRPDDCERPVEIISIGDTTVELLEITGGCGPENEDSTSRSTSSSCNSQSSAGGGGIDTCVVDSERFELLEVEDDLGGTSSSASSSPALFASQLTPPAASPLSSAQTPDNSDHNDRASITVQMESDDTYLVTVVESTADSADGAILVEFSDIDESGGDVTAANNTAPSRRPARRQTRKTAPITGASTSSSSSPSTPEIHRSSTAQQSATTDPMQAVQLAMKQLARLSQSSDGSEEPTTATPSPTDSAETTRQHNSTREPAASSESAASPKPPTPVKTPVRLGAPRVTRKNSILFVPSPANRSKMLSKLLAGSPADARLCKKLLKAELQKAADGENANNKSKPTPAKKMPSNHSQTDGNSSDALNGSVYEESVSDSAQALMTNTVDINCSVVVEPLSKDIVANGYLDGVRDSPVEMLEPIANPVTVAGAKPKDNNVDQEANSFSLENLADKEKESAVTEVFTDPATLLTPPTSAKSNPDPQTMTTSAKTEKPHDSKRSENGCESDSRKFTPSPSNSTSASDKRKSGHNSTSSTKPKSLSSSTSKTPSSETNGPKSGGSEKSKSSSSSAKSSSGSGSNSSSSNSSSRKSSSAEAPSTKKPPSTSAPHKEPGTSHSHSSKHHHDHKRSSNASSASSGSHKPSFGDSLKKLTAIATPSPKSEATPITVVTPPPKPAAVHRRPSIESTTPKPPTTPSPGVITIDKEAAARRAKRTAARLESTFRDRNQAVAQKKAVPQRKFDPQAILSDCYMPKQVKHDASLYSIEAMRAAKARLDAEAAIATATAGLLSPDTVPASLLVFAAAAESPIASMAKLFDHSSTLPGLDSLQPSEAEKSGGGEVMQSDETALEEKVLQTDSKAIIESAMATMAIKDESMTIKDESMDVTENDCKPVIDDMNSTVPAVKEMPMSMDTAECNAPADLPDSGVPKAIVPGPVIAEQQAQPVAPPVKTEDNPDESRVSIETKSPNDTADVSITSLNSSIASGAGDLEESNNIRRSGRIKIITETKQRSRGFGLVRDKVRIHNTMTPKSDLNATSTGASPADPTDSAASSASAAASATALASSSSSSSLTNSPADSSSRSPSELPPDAVERTAAQLEKQQRDLREGLSLFRQIADNEFRSERNISKETRRMQCDCFLTAAEVARGEFGCGEDCMNRMLMIECGPRCVVGDRCTNKRFQRHQTSACTIFKTDKKGFGLQASAFITAGDFIMEYVGEVLNGEQFEERATEYGKEKNRHHYFMALRSDCVIDATIKGNISRFINHSCDPNAETQKWTVNGELRIGFFSIKDVAPGEEITFDYQFQRYGKAAQRCYCEADCCRGWIGEEPDSDDEVEDDDEDADKGKLSPAVDAEQPAVARNLKSPMLQKPPHKARKAKPKAATTTAAADKPKKTPKPKRAEIMEDPDLDMHIDILQRSQLKNQAQTLRFSRLVVRAKLRHAKSQLLRILCAGELACRRLFLDYHGLKLLHAWMCDESSDATDAAATGAAGTAEELVAERERKLAADWAFRLEILQTLQVLPIPNKLLLDDSKVLKTVGEWAKLKTDVETVVEVKVETTTAAAAADEQKATESPTGCDIPKLLEENTLIKDINLDALKEIINTNEANAKRLNAEANVKTEPTVPAAAVAASTVTTTPPSAPATPKPPAILHDVVALARLLVTNWSQLPEVFRIPKKQRIEQMKEHEREANRNYRALGNPGDQADNGSSDPATEATRRRNMDRFRERERRGTVDCRSPLPAQLASAPPSSNPGAGPSGGTSGAGAATMSPLAMVGPAGLFQRPPPPSSNPTTPLSVTESGLTKHQRRQMFEARVAAEKQMCDLQHLHMMKCAFFNINPRLTTELMLPFFVDPLTNQWYGRYGHPLQTPPIYAHIKRPPTSDPSDYQMPVVELPHRWRWQIEPNGRLYYYHQKIRISQWEPPIKLMPLNGNAAAESGSAGDAVATATSTDAEQVRATDADADALGSDSESDTDEESVAEAKEQALMDQIQIAIGAQRVHLNILSRQNSSLDLTAAITVLASTTGAEPTTHFSDDQLSAAEQSVLENRVHIQLHPNHEKMRQEREMSPRSLEERRMHRTEKRVYRANKEKVRCEKRLLALQAKQSAAATTSAASASTNSGAADATAAYDSDAGAMPASKIARLEDVVDGASAAMIVVEDVGAYTTICTTGLNGQLVEDDLGDDDGNVVTVTVANANGNAAGEDDEDDSDADMDDEADGSFAMSETDGRGDGNGGHIDDDEDDVDIGNYAKLHGVDELSMDDAVIVRKMKRRALAVAMEDHAPCWNVATKRHAEHSTTPSAAGSAKRAKPDETAGGGSSCSSPSSFGTPEARESPVQSAAETAKRIKDKFRGSISNVIVPALSNYRRDSCTIGHITNDDDFKHLAKKLAHFVMLKELKHCADDVAALEVNESVRAKAREFVRKYMLKFGATYKRPDNEQ